MTSLINSLTLISSSVNTIFPDSIRLNFNSLVIKSLILYVCLKHSFRLLISFSLLDRPVSVNPFPVSASDFSPDISELICNCNILALSCSSIISSDRLNAVSGVFIWCAIFSVKSCNCLLRFSIYVLYAPSSFDIFSLSSFNLFIYEYTSLCPIFTILYIVKASSITIIPIITANGIYSPPYKNIYHAPFLV